MIDLNSCVGKLLDKTQKKGRDAAMNSSLPFDTDYTDIKNPFTKVISSQRVSEVTSGTFCNWELQEWDEV